jgi:hypothetical protein
MTAFVCLPARCQCKKHFVRNNITGECVSRKQCSNITLGGPMTPANQLESESSDDRQKRQAPIGIPVQIGTTTTNTPGGLKINPVGPMIPANQSSSESGSGEAREKRQAPIGIPVQIGTSTTFSPGALQINPGGLMIPANDPGSCKENEIWQTCNPCEKTCQVPNVRTLIKKYHVFTQPTKHYFIFRQDKKPLDVCGGANSHGVLSLIRPCPLSTLTSY